MWYFAWVLGLGLAIAAGILNGLWFEMHSDDADDRWWEDSEDRA